MRTGRNKEHRLFQQSRMLLAGSGGRLLVLLHVPSFPSILSALVHSSRVVLVSAEEEGGRGRMRAATDVSAYFPSICDYHFILFEKHQGQADSCWCLCIFPRFRLSC